MPSVKILGDKEMYVKAGTAVTLRCLISNCLEEPAYVFWYHGDRRLLDDEDQIPGKFLAKSIFTVNNLFVTSKNGTVNSPIHEFKVLLKGQIAF